MMKKTYLFCLLFLIQQSYSQNTDHNVFLTDSSVIIDNQVVKNGIRAYLFKVSDFSTILKDEKVKKVHDRKMKVWDYYFLNSGVAIKMYNKKSGLNSIYVFFSNGTPYFKNDFPEMQFYKAKFTLLDIPIDETTTISHIKEKIPKNSGEVTFSTGRISIYFKHVLYDLTFENESPEARIVFISIR